MYNVMPPRADQTNGKQVEPYSPWTEGRMRWSLKPIYQWLCMLIELCIDMHYHEGDDTFGLRNPGCFHIAVKFTLLISMSV